MFIYKINFRFQVKNGWLIVPYLFIAIGYLTYNVLSFGIDIYYIVMPISFFSLFFVPTLIIHLNYYFKNKNDIFLYDSTNRNIEFCQKGQKYHFDLDEIEFIKRYMSYPLAEDRLQWLPWDNYNFSIVFLNSGDSFIITSLLVPNLDLPIEEYKKSIVKSYYCLAVFSESEKKNDDKEIPDIFIKKIRSKSEAELKEILNNKTQYHELFVQGAFNELKERKTPK